MIDSEGFRSNVGIIVCNDFGNLLWTRRIGQNSWQFAQGGVDPGESAEQAMFRELNEELGLTKKDVRILGSTKEWLKYRLPNRYIRQGSLPLCIGQKQKWFMLRLTGHESAIHFDATGHPEFDHFMWVNYWYPLRQVIAFKRDVYRQALVELMPCVIEQQARQRKKRKKPHRSHKRKNESNES
ncbi:MAG: RNA pyrophosphohydrolase [Kangiellaceae bacterium]|nr:RNA pyrophosphohydrolase [Kangiellaceae bacterium]